MTYRPDQRLRRRSICSVTLRHGQCFVETTISGVFSVRASSRTTRSVRPKSLHGTRAARRQPSGAGGSLRVISKMVDFSVLAAGRRVFVMGLHHTIHHRGQLTAYIRAIAAVPSIWRADARVARRPGRSAEGASILSGDRHYAGGAVFAGILVARDDQFNRRTCRADSARPTCSS